ncbi:MAG TPA: hypothetical protein DHW14_04455, partial [Clostridiales bacterium]|nr:hypothetical protein [Clostridiales bacterium]
MPARRRGRPGLTPQGMRGDGRPLPRHLRRTKIVATLGPASEDLETMARMIEAGMDVAR